MEYKKITVEEKQSAIDNFIRAQELDHHCHTINVERFRAMLADVGLVEGAFKERLKKLLSDTEERLSEIELILKHTKTA